MSAVTRELAVTRLALRRRGGSLPAPRRGPASDGRHQGASRTFRALFLVAAATVLAAAAPARAHESRADTRPAALRDVAFDQRVNQQVPLDLALRDEDGRQVRLGDYFGQRPVILALVYHRCQNLCPLALDGLVRALRPLSFSAGDQFSVVAVSFDPRDLPAMAAARKAEVLRRYGRPGAAAGWHFLTGEEAAIRRLAAAVGFQYAYDPATDQYAHATGLVILSPRGTIFRYLYGIEYSPRVLRLSLVEAAENRIGSPIDQVLLFCYHYDPATGRYSLLVMRLVRLAGLATVAGLGTLILVMWRRDRRHAARAGEAG